MTTRSKNSDPLKHFSCHENGRNTITYFSFAKNKIDDCFPNRKVRLDKLCTDLWGYIKQLIGAITYIF